MCVWGGGAGVTLQDAHLIKYTPRFILLSLLMYLSLFLFKCLIRKEGVMNSLIYFYLY